MQPIIELEIVNEIMHAIRNKNIGFYQRELSYNHCDIVNQLEIIFSNITPEEKDKIRMQSLPFCNGDYLIPLLKKLKQTTVDYNCYVLSILVHKFYDIRKENLPKENFLGQLFLSLQIYTNLYEKTKEVQLKEEQLLVILEYKLNDFIEKSKIKINA